MIPGLPPGTAFLRTGLIGCRFIWGASHATLPWTVMIITMRTVSYTHLDVYKRQEQDSYFERNGCPAFNLPVWVLCLGANYIWESITNTPQGGEIQLEHKEKDDFDVDIQALSLIHIWSYGHSWRELLHWSVPLPGNCLWPGFPRDTQWCPLPLSLIHI